jgi:hypothetical protein
MMIHHKGGLWADRPRAKESRSYNGAANKIGVVRVQGSESEHERRKSCGVLPSKLHQFLDATRSI